MKALFQRMASKPRKSQDGYPLDLDASERFTRLSRVVAYHPTPPMVGMVSGFLPQYDAWVYAQAYGRDVSGPAADPAPRNLNLQIFVPGLNKHFGTGS